MMEPQKPSPTNPFLFGLGGIAGAMFTAVAIIATQPAVDPDWQAYQRVRDLIEREYVQPVNRQDLLAEAMDGMVGSLDPYSRFYVGEPLKRVQQETRGTFVGLGAIFDQPMDKGRILFPMPNSPAQRANLQIGDQILTFDGLKVAEFEPGGFAEHLRSLEPGLVPLQVRRLSGEVVDLELNPGFVVDPTVRHVDLLDEHIGYLALISFSRESLGEFDLAVRELKERGATSLILDLRGNPGGVLVAALDLANRFVDQGVLLVTETRTGHVEERAQKGLATLLGMPLVILVDEDSASASEVVAGALQDQRRAAIVGTQTYGKGTIQTLTPLGNPDSMLKITTGFYATPSGRSIDRYYREDGGSAIWPDIEVELNAHERAALHNHLLSYSPPFASVAAVDALERQLGREPVARVQRDAQVLAAIELLTTNPLQ